MSPRAPGRGRARLLRPGGAGRRRRRSRRSRGFPFEICDLTDGLRAAVIGDFVAEHAAGRTPNPCARCNGEIKFGAFLRRADELGVDLVATGHYVRTRRATPRARGICCRGADPAKDQSYMLHMLGQASSPGRVFPVGGLPKARDPRARRSGSACRWPPSRTPRSSASPRAGDAGRLRSLAGARARARRRRVVDPRGPRARPSTTAPSPSRSDSGAGSASRPARPPYVLETDAATNRVVVGPAELLARRASWRIARPGSPARRPPSGPFEARVRVRYRGEDVAGGPHADGPAASRSRSVAAARHRAGAERRRLPRRRGARRRPHRGRTRRRPGRRVPATRLPCVKLLRRRAKSLRHPGPGPRRCTSPRPRTTRRSRAPPRCRSGSSSSPTALRDPEFRTSKRPSTAWPPMRPRSSRRSSRRPRQPGSGPMFSLPRRRGRRRRAVPRRAAAARSRSPATATTSSGRRSG